jgi:hypothetical protein
VAYELEAVPKKAKLFNPEAVPPDTAKLPVAEEVDADPPEDTPIATEFKPVATGLLETDA